MKSLKFRFSATPGLNSYEGETGNLTWSYATAVDCRFRCVQLGPLMTTVSLTASQGSTVTNSRSMAFSEEVTSDVTECVLIANGTKVSYIRLSTRLEASDGGAANFSSSVTHLITTRSANGTQEVSVCLESNIYQVITALVTGEYTTSANNESIINRFHVKGPSYEADGQIFGLGQASSIENKLRHNVLTGTVTMDASAWATRATIGDSNFTFTGGVLDGNFLIVGTTDGPYRFNNDHQVFVAMMPSLTPSANNCKGMDFWEKMGTVIPLERETRVSIGLDGYSIGPEMYPYNTSPVQGRLTAQNYNEQWGWWAIRSPYGDTARTADATYLCAVKPPKGYGRPAEIYPITKLSDGLECEAIAFAGIKGGVTQNTWYAGLDDDAMWWIEGNNKDHNLDPNCTYATGGSLYTTEVMRDPDKDKTPKAIKIKTSGCTATETIIITQHWTDKFGAAQSVVLSTINSNGTHILDIPREKQIAAASFYLEIALARGGTTTATPRILPQGEYDLLMLYDESSASDQNGRTLEQVAN